MQAIFSPENTIPALDLYRRSFQPSEVLSEPYAMVGVNVVAAETDEKAVRLSTSLQQQFLNLLRNNPGPLLPPVDNIEEFTSEYERALLNQRLGSSIIGGPETVREKLQAFLDKTQADEMIINSQIYDHQARLKSYQIVSELNK